MPQSGNPGLLCFAFTKPASLVITVGEEQQQQQQASCRSYRWMGSWEVIRHELPVACEGCGGAGVLPSAYPIVVIITSHTRRSTYNKSVSRFTAYKKFL